MENEPLTSTSSATAQKHKPNQRNTEKVTKIHTVGLLQRLGVESTGAHGVCIKSNRNIKKFIPKVRPMVSSWGKGCRRGTPRASVRGTENVVLPKLNKAD